MVNVVLNPGFERGVVTPTDWETESTITAEFGFSPDAYEGTRSAIIKVTERIEGAYPHASYVQRLQTSKLIPGKTIALSMAYKTNVSYSHIEIEWFDAEWKVMKRTSLGTLLADNKWHRPTVVDVVPKGFVYAWLFATIEYVGNLRLDAASVETEVGVGTVNVHAIADSEEVTASFMVSGQGPYDTPWRLKLTPATYTLIGNYKGQTDTKTVEIKGGETKTVTFTFAKMHKFTIVSAPTPVNFTLNGEAMSTPFSQDMPSGTYTLVMPFRVMVKLDEYVFEQWENGSRKPTRTITLESPQEVTLTATYRLRQIDEAGPINQRQAKDTLQEVFGQGADLSQDNPLPTEIVSPLPLPTEDTGAHSNPRKYEKTYGFVSARVASAAAAVELWAVGLAAVNPVVGRTAGRDTTVYTLEIENSTGAAVTAWLEDDAGNRITIDYHIANNDSQVLDFVAGKNYGDMDIYFNASVVAVAAQITGTEE